MFYYIVVALEKEGFLSSLISNSNQLKLQSQKFRSIGEKLYCSI